MKVFIDFDDTLFNTSDFMNDYSQLFVAAGLTPEIYETTYKEAHRRMGKSIEVYEAQMHTDALARQYPDINIKTLRANIAVFLKDTSVYVFPDVKPFLEQAQKKRIQLYVLSFGQSQFQSEKITGTGLTPYFQEVFIVQEKKYEPIIEVMKCCAPDEPIWFFDDRAEFVQDVNRRLPQVKTVQVTRPEGRYRDNRSPDADFIVPDFSRMIFPK
jgi:FMN phosphatase YigB (HAD superfamily)